MLILETSIKDFYTWMSTAKYDLSLVKIDENLFLMFFPMKIIARQYGVLLVFKESFFSNLAIILPANAKTTDFNSLKPKITFLCPGKVKS